jgi:predicted transcriptional regulator
LGITATEVSRQLGISQPAVSISAKRGEKIAMAEKLKLIGD